ncbi:MAG: 23S rRNA (adenine(2030)-N(6))-methyltransferase RlmJ [Lysobacterales bacterium 69-70]|nr:23S rRNA (adenine(2030)-N(6))-methyltransferase RlmJ [Xanthomonadaceae bacterium]ODU36141.1 MAG: 23S rRNA (adenine(2030)-N(6))-methyltransferase RlmJ [Xanthomonadaceae bacterium SCN 69-320]ODV17593.1 MAG: 23S rRNA (adenine(2030)-N(6))-methyltransferase RlmJ [Xanthomonadaceae bacterium SCN 69-25]OJY99400.1 MAG: 23S rRNA (adenine(2030)-N(6))-methyltransferase RlmJ [Xanthomonadales bacterium 69-70]
MNYRHAYHAGNFADVLKHSVLVGLIEALKQKQTPFCYIDTHAGRGQYDLHGEEARKTREFADGVLRLLDAARLPAALHVYLNLVRALNTHRTGHDIAVYPGSPLLASLLLRDDDRAQLCELQPEEAAALRALFRGDARVAVHERDGYEALKSLLPPKEKRGLVLIDPPFEAQDGEFRLIEAALKQAQTRWPNGIYAIWYPIKLRQQLAGFYRWLRASGFARVLTAELLVHPDNSALRLNGTGMAIINPPWKFERQLEELLPVLTQHLAQGRFGQHQVQWLVQEPAAARSGPRQT